MGLDVEEEGFNRGRWVPFLVEKEGEAFDIGGSDGPVAIVEIGKDVTNEAVPKAALTNAERRFISFGDSAIKGFLDDAVYNLVV